MDVGTLDFVVAASAVLVGSVVQGSIGFGVNLLAAPFVAIVVPEALPATMTLVALPIAITTVRREHHAVDRLALPWMLVGAVPGTLIGLGIVSEVSGESLALVVGSVTLVGVLLSTVVPPLPHRASAAFAAGFLSNIFGTASSVGGPPVALLFQHREGPTARSTLGAFFAVSATMSLVGYLITETVTLDHLWFALGLAPFMVAGLWSSRHLHRHVDGGWLRPAVLALSAIAGAAAIVRGLT
jgi:uncharacterized membrane protein YfcA